MANNGGPSSRLILDSLLEKLSPSPSTSFSSLEEQSDEDRILLVGPTLGSSLSSQSSSFEEDDIFADKIASDLEVSSPFRLPKYFQAIITLIVCGVLLLCTLGIIKQVRILCHKSSCNKASLLPLIKVDSAKDSKNEDCCDSILIAKNGNKSSKNGSSTDGSNAKKNGSLEGSTQRPNVGNRHFDYYRSSSPGVPIAPNTPPDFFTSNGANDSNPKTTKTPSATSAAINGATSNVEAKPSVQDSLKVKRSVRFVRRTSGPFSDEAMDFAGETYKTDKDAAPYLSKEKMTVTKIDKQPKFKFQSIRKNSQATIPSGVLPPPPPHVKRETFIPSLETIPYIDSSIPPPLPTSKPPPL